MSRRALTQILVATVAFGLTACTTGSPAPPVAADSSQAGSPSATTMTLPPSPSATPTALSKEEAGAKYLELVGPPNDMVRALHAAVAANDAGQLRAVAVEAASTHRAFADALVETRWPPEAQGAVDRLISELASQITVLLSMGAAETDEQVWAEFATWPDATGASQEIRILLGLENVPTE